MPVPFALVSPTGGIATAITRQLLRNTSMPVYATFRSGSAEDFRQRILSNQDVDPNKLRVLRLDLTSEKSIYNASQELAHSLKDTDSYLHTAFLTGGILHPEKKVSDLDLSNITSTFEINVISHLLMIKHFSTFLPSQSKEPKLEDPSKWVHVSARVGSISDNARGGWYSYRASKAALNQVIRTFDLELKMKKSNAIAVGIHPGTVKTELSRDFWKGVPEGSLFSTEEAADKIIGVVDGMQEEVHRGRVWDHAGKEIMW